MGITTCKKKIIIRRTPGEFELAKHRLSIEEGKKDIRNYLATSAIKLVNVFNECPNCITAAYGEKKSEIAFFVDEEVHEILMQISDIMKKPLSSIIDDFFIAPLLMPKMK